METDFDKTAMEIFDELNLARQVPNALVAGLTEKLEFFDENVMTVPGYDHPYDTYEGAKAVFSSLKTVVQRRHRLPPEAGVIARAGLQQGGGEGRDGARRGHR